MTVQVSVFSSGIAWLTNSLEFQLANWLVHCLKRETVPPLFSSPFPRPAGFPSALASHKIKATENSKLIKFYNTQSFRQVLKVLQLSCWGLAFARLRICSTWLGVARGGSGGWQLLWLMPFNMHFVLYLICSQKSQKAKSNCSCFCL